MITDTRTRPSTVVDDWLRPHLRALEASVRSGFRFRHLPTVDDLVEVLGFRVARGAIDVFRARSAHVRPLRRFSARERELRVTG